MKLRANVEGNNEAKVVARASGRRRVVDDHMACATPTTHSQGCRRRLSGRRSGMAVAGRLKICDLVGLVYSRLLIDVWHAGLLQTGVPGSCPSHVLSILLWLAFVWKGMAGSDSDSAANRKYPERMTEVRIECCVCGLRPGSRLVVVRERKRMRRMLPSCPPVNALVRQGDNTIDVCAWSPLPANHNPQRNEDLPTR